MHLVEQWLVIKGLQLGRRTILKKIDDSYCFWATDLKYALMKAIQELAAKVAKLEAA